MEINVYTDEELEAPINEGLFINVAEKVLAALDAHPSAELGLVIATQEKIRELNRQYLGRDRPTDVIVFSMLPSEQAENPDNPEFMAPPDGIVHLGEAVISYPQAMLQAEEQGHSIDKEMTILVIHGILHLFGYEDEKPDTRRLMREKEAEILRYIEGS
jgi:probable rRNA maturation factor